MVSVAYYNISHCALSISRLEVKVSEKGVCVCVLLPNVHLGLHLCFELNF